MSNQEPEPEASAPTPSESFPPGEPIPTLSSLLSRIGKPAGCESFPEMGWFRHRVRWDEGPGPWGYVFSTAEGVQEEGAATDATHRGYADYRGFEYEAVVAPPAAWLRTMVADLRQRATALFAWAAHHAATAQAVEDHAAAESARRAQTDHLVEEAPATAPDNIVSLVGKPKDTP